MSIRAKSFANVPLPPKTSLEFGALGTLMARRTVTTVEIGGRTLELSNAEKVLWPEDGYTKADLVAYYRAAAPYLLPHLAGRPLTLQRYPDGIEGPSFFEKDAPRGTPEWVHTVTVPSEYGKRGEVRYAVCDDEPTLVFVANLATIVLHVWTSRIPKLDAPDLLLFDLDPGDECTVATLAKVAVAFRAALDGIGLRALVKSTGGAGLHVIVPLEPRYDYDLAKGFAELVARHVNGSMPAETTLERSTKRRPAHAVYLDYVQVGRGKTLVAPYSVRARRGAPVSMPLAWDEIDAMTRKRGRDTEAENARYTIANVPRLVGKRGDPWRDAGKGQRLEKPLAAARKTWRT
jgi:bifunctional non-homologous end joining protein LigD